MLVGAAVSDSDATITTDPAVKKMCIIYTWNNSSNLKCNELPSMEVLNLPFQRLWTCVKGRIPRHHLHVWRWGGTWRRWSDQSWHRASRRSQWLLLGRSLTISTLTYSESREMLLSLSSLHFCWGKEVMGWKRGQSFLAFLCKWWKNATQ